MRRSFALKILAALGGLVLAEARFGSVAQAQDIDSEDSNSLAAYRGLASRLVARYPRVKNPSRLYLGKEFIPDPSIRLTIDATALATSNTPDSVRGLRVQRDTILLQLKPDAGVDGIESLLQKYE